jgi:hypothetical protein
LNVKPAVGFTLPSAGLSPAPSIKKKLGSAAIGSHSADLAEMDFSDEDLDRDDVFGSDADDLDSVAGFDSLAGFDDESLDEDSVAPLVAVVGGVDAESDSVLLGALFLA